MRKKYIFINTSIMFFSLIILLLASCLIVSNVNKKNIEHEIKNYLQIVGNNFSKDDLIRSARVVTSADDSIRVTFIDGNGVVLYDTSSTTIEENHLDRLELQNLGEIYYRYSSSLDIRMVYVASFIDGIYIRVSMPQASVGGVVNALIGYGILTLLLICVITILLLEKTFKQIVRPIQQEVEKLSFVCGESTAVQTFDVDEISEQIDMVHKLIDKKIFSLSRQTDKLNYILNHMQQGLIIINAIKNVILVNQLALDIFRCREEEVLSKSYVYILRDIRIQELVEETISKKKEESIRIDIEDRTYLFNVSSLEANFASYNDSNGVAIFIMDVTKEERLEKMKLDFFANASHELKSPLTAVIGYQQMIEQGILTDDAEIREATSKTILEANRMNQIIIEMLQLSKLEMNPSTKKESLSIRATINSIVNTYQALLKQRKIKLSLSGTDFLVEMNKDDLDRLVRNLLDNAIKYNMDGGNIQIEIDEKEKTLSVIDSGIGIPLEHQQRVFERFYRVDKAKSKELGGTGLGLAIVKHICINNNATIVLVSEEGKGSNFTIKWNKK